MTRTIWFAIALLWLRGVSLLHAQESPPVDVVPEPPGQHTEPIVEPAPAGRQVTPPLPQGWSSTSNVDARRLFNIWLGLGIGDAVGCGNEDPDSPCAIDGAATFALGVDYRFHPNFSAGLEVGYWSFAVSDTWRGQLMGMPDSDRTSIDASYFAIFGRWYWFDRGIVDPYLQLGFGGGSITAEIANASESYRYTSSGFDTQLGAGVEFRVHPLVKLGPQFLAALLIGNEICEQPPGMAEMCRKPAKNDKGEREGNALAWRFMLTGTVMLGER